MPLVGCSETSGEGGSGGSAGEGGSAGMGGGGVGGDGGQGGVTTCVSNVCPCTEAGIRAAIEEGGGRFTFGCEGPTTVVTKATIEIDNDVILDGEDNLTVDGNEAHRVFSVLEGVRAELRGFIVTRGFRSDDNPMFPDENGGGIANRGTLTIASSTVSGNRANGAGGGIANVGTLTVTDSTISDNLSAYHAGGISSRGGTLTVTNSTISGNYSSHSGGGIEGGTVSLTNSTVSGNTAESKGGGISSEGSIVLVSSTVVDNTSPFISGIVTFNEGTLTATSTIIEGDCATEKVVTSGGYNIESPGDTCGFDPDGTDQVDVTEGELNLGELAANGGPTMTHEPGDGGFGDGSAAINKIPAADCEVDTDQRGKPRPETGGTMCDVGSVEVQPSGL
jgi:predicted outer membrane repeat protein